MELSLHELTNNYAELRETLETTEANFKAYKAEVEKKINDYQAQILEEMNKTATTKISTAVGDFTKTTKQRAAITSTVELEKCILEFPELIKFISLKPKITEIKKHVEISGESPSPYITYERFFDIAFRRAK